MENYERDTFPRRVVNGIYILDESPVEFRLHAVPREHKTCNFVARKKAPEPGIGKHVPDHFLEWNLTCINGFHTFLQGKPMKDARGTA
jgi:hypothetical protein